jgi:tellurite resistance protein
MKSKITLQLRNLIEKIVGEKSRISPELRQQALDTSLAVMALVAAADESIDDTEITQVQELYAKHGGGLVDTATVRRAFHIVVADETATWRQLSMARSLGDELREEIFLAALRVARADLDVHEHESALLARIGEALGLPQSRIDDLCEREL